MIDRASFHPLLWTSSESDFEAEKLSIYISIRKPKSVKTKA